MTNPRSSRNPVPRLMLAAIIGALVAPTDRVHAQPPPPRSDDNAPPLSNEARPADAPIEPASKPPMTVGDIARPTDGVTPITQAHLAARGAESRLLPPRVCQVTWITKAHLAARVPNFFSYDDPFAARPGKRIWMRVDDRHFIERYPDGTERRFLIFGHAIVRGMTGTVVIKLADDRGKEEAEDDEAFQVFIPDKGNPEMRMMINQASGAQPAWFDLGWAQDKKMILDNVE